MRTFEFTALGASDLVVDALYRGGTAGNAGDDAIARLLPVGNQGGFRYRGTLSSPRLVALVTAGRQAAWPDELDPYTGVFTYFGDNRTPGHQLHETRRQGNLILANAFASAHGVDGERRQVPPFLLFAATGNGRDVVFRGLAVPGAASLSSDEDLVAVWRTASGERFQNYRARFTVLDVPVVPRAWLQDIAAGVAESPSAPDAWVTWIRTGGFRPLIAPRTGTVRTAAEQLPKSAEDQAVLDAIRARCATSPVDFEHVAAELWRMSVAGRVQLDVTRPSRDGGRDAVGALYLGPPSDQIGVEFALEAKCYGPRNSVGVRETSRLISRLRHRQFGVLVTTSYVGAQAYAELRDDGHPVVVLSGGDLVAILRRAGLGDAESVRLWMEGVIPRR